MLLLFSNISLCERYSSFNMKISQVMRSYPKTKEAYLEFVALFNIFRAGNQVGEDWKKVNCLGDKMLYSRRCVFC